MKRSNFCIVGYNNLMPSSQNSTASLPYPAPRTNIFLKGSTFGRVWVYVLERLKLSILISHIRYFIICHKVSFGLRKGNGNQLLAISMGIKN